jgi:ATP-dependent Clp protease ATP-binding subunit ClpA
MYERFTDRARKVMQLANQEAQRFNHEYIGTEHVLLGLIKEGSGVAAWTLKNFDIGLDDIRREVEKLMQSGTAEGCFHKLPQALATKKVIEYSMEEARNLNHNYVGTEHILLGLLREEEGVAAQVLMNLGLKLKEVREEVLDLLGHKGGHTGVRTAPIDFEDWQQLSPGVAWDAYCKSRKEIERLRVEVLCRENAMVLYVGKLTELLTELQKAAEWTADPEAARAAGKEDE